jgi:hypothetical protein
MGSGLCIRIWCVETSASFVTLYGRLSSLRKVLCLQIAGNKLLRLEHVVTGEWLYLRRLSRLDSLGYIPPVANHVAAR